MRYHQVNPLIPISNLSKINTIIDNIPTAWGGHRPFADWIVRRYIPDNVVELGVAHGFSLFSFAYPNYCPVYGFDKFDGDEHAGFMNYLESFSNYAGQISALGLNNFHIFNTTFNEGAKSFNEKIDILHIDGRHYYDDVKEDFTNWYSKCHSDSIVLMHDTQSFPNDVGRFFKEINLPKFEILHTHGLGIVSANSNIILEIQKIWKRP